MVRITLVLFIKAIKSSLIASGLPETAAADPTFSICRVDQSSIFNSTAYVSFPFLFVFTTRDFGEVAEESAAKLSQH